MKIVFFDGYCNLCNFWVDFLFKADKAQILKFASLQGETAKQFLNLQNVSSSEALETIIYFRNNQVYEQSSAVLMILTDLGRGWKLFKVFFLFPKGLRDWIYTIIAQNRYRLFGKRDSCRLPTPSESARLLP